MGFWMSRTDAALAVHQKNISDEGTASAAYFSPKARVPRATAIEPPWVGRFVTCNIQRQMSKRTKHTRSFIERSFTTSSRAIAPISDTHPRSYRR
ncbi:hypothetical protein PEC311524_37720 [Pectobacterium carotovorum subsp. carotovorum]|nr:hypothetical protein PEC311524_37720 [Pectobacterium carotovorum subsp. carotovorum]